MAATQKDVNVGVGVCMSNRRRSKQKIVTMEHPSVKSTFRMDRDDGSKFTAGIGNKETTTASPLHRRNTTAFLPDVDGATFEETKASR